MALGTEETLREMYSLGKIISVVLFFSPFQKAGKENSLNVVWGKEDELKGISYLTGGNGSALILTVWGVRSLKWGILREPLLIRDARSSHTPDQNGELKKDLKVRGTISILTSCYNFLNEQAKEKESNQRKLLWKRGGLRLSTEEDNEEKKKSLLSPKERSNDHLSKKK